jgi:hypothetical protein
MIAASTPAAPPNREGREKTPAPIIDPTTIAVSVGMLIFGETAVFSLVAIRVPLGVTATESGKLQTPDTEGHPPIDSRTLQGQAVLIQGFPTS